MIILEDKYRVPSKEEIESLDECVRALNAGFEKSVRIYSKDVLAIGPIVADINKNLLPRKRAHEAGFPVNTFRFILEDSAKLADLLDAHGINKYIPDLRMIASWLCQHPIRNDIIIGS